MNNGTQKTKTVGFRQFQHVLEEKSEQLRAQIGNPVSHPVLHAIGDPYDTADWAEKSHEEWIFLAKNNFDVSLLREIENALQQIRDGSYGTCQECGEPIPRKRLEAIPWARYCFACQERRQSSNN